MAIAALKKIGLIPEEMVAPRELSGPLKAVVSVTAVGFSYFFIHIAYFGPPVAEVFKGTFLLGIAVLSILTFRGRQRPLREGAVWLDEILSFLAIAMMCAMFAIWIYWELTDGERQWRRFVGSDVYVAAAIGALLGALVYAFEATRARVGDALTLSDVLFLVAAIAPIVWWIWSNEELSARIGSPVPVPVVFFSGLFACVSFDIARRIVGPVIPAIAIMFLIYSFEPVARAMPGLFSHWGFSLERVMEFLLLSTDGMTGLIVEVFATYVVIFVIVGAFLEKTGLGALFIDATYRLTGQRTGGPGLAAVTSSGLFGMISGSGVANVVTTGTFTIPLMKRVGYRPEFAGAVEAAASTGGSYMPPIMGAGAFLLAQLTEISYFEVIKIALIPALLYYLSVGLIVYLRAVRRGLHGVPVEELPPWSRIIPRLPMLLPIPVMVYYLVLGDSPFLAAVRTIFLIVSLKAVDLLLEIRTPWAARTARPFLAAAIFVGVVAYFVGPQIGPPFTWLADPYTGINMGAALMGAITTFIALKLAEILLASLLANPDQPMEAVFSDQAHADGSSDGDSGQMRAQAGETVPAPRPLVALGQRAFELCRVVWAAMEAGARNNLVIGCIAGVLGILLTCATQSDLPGRISVLLIELSFGLLPLTIFWVVVAGYVVGMGLPITASYVVLVIFSVGALTNLGVPTVAAHLICYWVAVVSAVTPPVALAAYAASAIDRSDLENRHREADAHVDDRAGIVVVADRHARRLELEHEKQDARVEDDTDQRNRNLDRFAGAAGHVARRSRPSRKRPATPACSESWKRDVSTNVEEQHPAVLLDLDVRADVFVHVRVDAAEREGAGEARMAAVFHRKPLRRRPKRLKFAWICPPGPNSASSRPRSFSRSSVSTLGGEVARQPRRPDMQLRGNHPDEPAAGGGAQERRVFVRCVSRRGSCRWPCPCRRVPPPMRGSGAGQATEREKARAFQGPRKSADGKCGVPLRKM